MRHSLSRSRRCPLPAACQSLPQKAGTRHTASVMGAPQLTAACEARSAAGGSSETASSQQRINASTRVVQVVQRVQQRQVVVLPHETQDERRLVRRLAREKLRLRP